MGASTCSVGSVQVGAALCNAVDNFFQKDTKDSWDSTCVDTLLFVLFAVGLHSVGAWNCDLMFSPPSRVQLKASRARVMRRPETKSLRTIIMPIESSQFHGKCHINGISTWAPIVRLRTGMSMRL